MKKRLEKGLGGGGRWLSIKSGRIRRVGSQRGNRTLLGWHRSKGGISYYLVS